MPGISLAPKYRLLRDELNVNVEELRARVVTHKLNADQHTFVQAVESSLDDASKDNCLCLLAPGINITKLLPSTKLTNFYMILRRSWQNFYIESHHRQAQS